MHTNSSIRVDCHDEDQIDEHEHEHEHGHEHGHKHEHGHDAARTRVGGVSRTGCARPSGAREKVRCTATSAIADMVVRITRWPNMSTAAPRKGDATAEITYCDHTRANGNMAWVREQRRAEDLKAFCLWFGTGIDIAKLTVLMASFFVGLKTPGCPKFR